MTQWSLLLAVVCLTLPLLQPADTADTPGPTAKPAAKKIIKKVRRRELREWDDSDPKVCSGTYNGRTMTGSDRIQDLRIMYENCTRVRGNLEISHLTAETMKNNNVSFSDTLKIFQHIEEIKGYLLIYNVDFNLVWLPNLKIIWGDTQFEGHVDSKEGTSLFISGNHKLQEIHMPKLRSIHSGNVFIENNTFLCYLKEKVYWDELVNMDKSRIIVGHTPHRDCHKYTADTQCHPSCESKHCWGGASNVCQELYRSPCPEQCGSTDSFGQTTARQCYYNQMEKAHKCCNPACEGGCFGGRDTDCVACKRFNLNNACVPECPPLKIYNRRENKLVDNPDGTYKDDRYCVKQCAANLLIEDGHCVRNCGSGSFHDVNKDTRMCEKCPEEGCTHKTCEVKEPLSRKILQGLEGCEVINGFLRIAGPIMQRSDTAFTAADLYVLRNVKIVSEYVYMVASSVSPSNMSFLENLEVIEGRALDTERYALVVSNNDNLRELGLKKLKKIKAGNVHIRDNHGLCFVSTVNWTANIMAGSSNTNIALNMDDKTCQRRNKVCSKECSQSGGCWGAGPKMCVQCASWMLNDTCVSQCPSEGYFEDDETRECKPCYKQCLQCRGPKKSDCTTCRNVSLFENNRLSCLDECKKTHYEERKWCLSCHESCYDLGCTGPNNTLGIGGCNVCRYALVDELHKVARCLYTDGSHHEVCEANNLTHHYYSSTKMEGVEQVHCAECDDSCVSCTSAGSGVDVSGCVCKDYVIELGGNSVCGPSCDQLYDARLYEIKPKNGDDPGICGRCSELCDPSVGCRGPSPADCEQCEVGSLSLNETIVCVAECPEKQPFSGLVDGQKVCLEEDQNVTAGRKRTIGIVIGIGSFLVVAIAASIIICKWRKDRRMLQKERNENLADIPEQLVVTSVNANLNQLALISPSNLQTKGSKLGNGAFGVVYAGYWVVKDGQKKVPVAIKVVSAVGKIRAQEEAAMLSEAGKMAHLRHQHLLRLIGICFRDDGIELVTPMRPLGNLLKFIKKHKKNLLGKYLLIYCYQIASAMKYLEEHKLVHRDLAARNVLVKKIDHVEVTDFGLSKFYAVGAQEVVIEEGKVPIKWMPPEVWETFTYTSQSDVWSYGVTCWEILTYGQSPYQGMSMMAIKDYLNDGYRLLKPNHCSTQLYQMLLQCWMVNPDSRPSFPVLYSRFREFCNTPNVFLVDVATDVSFSDVDLDQERMLREVMADELDCWDNVENPLEYFDNFGQDTDSLIGQPMARTGRRLTSSGSQRYQADPMAGMSPPSQRTSSSRDMLNKSISIAAEDNYLVPDSKLSEQQAILYTPVVVNDDNGGSEMTYYNDRPGPSKDHNYYNEAPRLKHQDSVLRNIQEEVEEVEKESCL